MHEDTTCGINAPLGVLVGLVRQASAHLSAWGAAVCWLCAKHIAFVLHLIVDSDCIAGTKGLLAARY